MALWKGTVPTPLRAAVPAHSLGAVSCEASRQARVTPSAHDLRDVLFTQGCSGGGGSGSDVDVYSGASAAGTLPLPLARRRARARREPESEPEVASGGSDSERDCALAPQLKRLRLTEACDSMTVDLSSKVRTALPFAAAGLSPASPAPMSPVWSLRPAAPRTEPPPAVPQLRAVPVAARGDGEEVPDEVLCPIEARRAEVQRRALEELRRYRQEVRNRESGMAVTWCPGY